MAKVWCVKITYLPQGIKSEELSAKFGVEQADIGIPHNQQGPNYYAWVNGFSDESSANQFVKKWNNKCIGSATIKCKAIDTKSQTLLQRPPSVPRIFSRVSGSGGQQIQSFGNRIYSKRGQSLEFGRILTSMASNKNNDSDDDNDSNGNREVVNRPSRVDRCNFTGCSSNIHDNSYACSATSKDFIRPLVSGFHGTRLRSRPRARDDSCSSRGTACRSGKDCFNPFCRFDHPLEWQACENGTDCEEFDCKANHPYGRTKPCLNGANCKNIACVLLHPATRMHECSDGDQCRVWTCKALHPNSRPKACFFGKRCYNTACLCLHPPDREVCPNGDECTDFHCQFDHSPSRIMRCDEGSTCSNYFCECLHPIDWDPCEQGSECVNANCSHAIHPQNRISPFQKNPINTERQKHIGPLLKSVEQRDIERGQAQLPILASKNEFCRRLKTERILVVTAATGSGKSTQLPQYAAEYFGGLVICTQPRVMAAISLARRVADEYDGTSVGRSVGYRVGRSSGINNKSHVPGTDIIFMTDSALIQESQQDPRLNKVKVLIIDEAHERALNTDIVIGIAKLLLSARTTDFYVVIASATIDPIKFLNFFDQISAQVLNVPGRIYDVSVEYIPKSDDLTDVEHAISILLQSYDKHQGHTLIFLPGQREIERALEIFSRNIPDNCVALPLYGSLSPEEQDKVLRFDDGPTEERRMVVFCTNVAETSLTIKNTRLVIDAGLAKEARFDSKRRLTVIETVRISRSSADQRKGRAGRTAPGHCVRLYRTDDLTRLNIEPEILRSSLDLVVLQLVRLQFTPQKFPFMDLPSSGTEFIEKSLQLLKDLSCIDINNAITLRGELFVELGLDPRLSAFMVDTYIEHSPILNVTTAIVAILTAPGSLFFMGGATQEAKQDARGRIAQGAQEYGSDLLYFASVYEKWKSVGMIDSGTHMCVKCQKVIKRNNSCRSCRAAYSVDNALNNKVLIIIESKCDASIKTMTNKRWKLNPRNLMDANQSNIIGIHLFRNFPEQYGHILVPHLPNEGVCMVVNDFRARITNTSVFVQRRLDSAYFVAMSITQLSSGEYVIERLHPISPPETASLKVIRNLSVFSHVGWELNVEIRKQANNFRTEPWNKWLIYEYDRRLCNLTVWGEENMQDSINRTLTPIVHNTLDSLLARNRSLDCGPIRASFESGLHCLRIENKHASTSTKNRLDLHRVPCKTFDELYEWLHNMLHARRQDIRENNFQPCKELVMNEDNYESPPFFVVFDSDEPFKRALLHLSPFNVYPQKADAFDTVHMNEKETWGRQLLLTFKKDTLFSEERVKTLLNKDIVSCKQIGKKLLPGLQLINMPTSVDKTLIQGALGNNLVPVRIDIYYSDKDNPRMGSSSARVYFETREQCLDALSRLRSSSLLKQHSIIIHSKKIRQLKKIPAVPSIQELKIEPQTFLITAISRQVALSIYSRSTSQWTVNSSACVTVTYHELYPDFYALLEAISTRFHTKIEKIYIPQKNNTSKAIRCIFTDTSPPKTALAASILSQATSPILIKLTDDRQKHLFNELFNENIIQTWANELRLLCEKKDKYGTVIEIRGPQIEQGQLMRRIADYSDDFDDRYRVLDLNAVIIGFFGRQKAADVKLRDMNSIWAQKGCTVTFERRTSSIILYAQPKVSAEMIRDCESEVKQLLDKLATANSEDEQQNDFARECSFCRRIMVATRTFRICGHAYCRCATNMLNKIPLECPTCNYKIHIQDLQEMYSNNRANFTQLCKRSIQAYLLSSTNKIDNDYLFCPNDECDGLISRSRGYQTCLTCGQGVCGLCRLIDDELHEGRTCAERNEAQEKLGDFIPQLFKTTEEFTRNSWPIELPSIIRFERNPYLLEKSCESLTRFYKGVESIGNKSPPDLARGIFAFHGTSVDAIEPICKSGFDPSRRRGQVHGPGEYFGITAAISHGYCKRSNASTNNQTMIIAFILQCDRVTTKPGFCYVVNNPIDWSAAFNLPVAVVTYGKDRSDHASYFAIATTSSIQSDYLSSKKTWQSLFRWFWQQDNGMFEPYNDVINGILEQLYENWQLGNGPSNGMTPPLIRYVDDTPQAYLVDFEKKTQRNAETNFLRRIERHRLRQLEIETSRNWFYVNEHNIWTPYESMIQQTIETAYQMYASGQGQMTVIIRFPGRPEQYELNFVTGRQMNMITGEIRLISRE